jgi:hypothetical protein
MKKIINIAILLSIAVTGVKAQQVSSHVPWTKEDSAAINALALYPDSIRMQIFQACEYPVIIVNVASLQKNSSTAFASLVSSFPQNKQEDIWNLTRYPNLISQLVQGGQKSKADIETILAAYPAEIHDVALNYATNDYDLLKSVDDLQNQTNQQFQQLISSYPPDVQKVFTNLLQLPEVLSLLNDHLSLTVRVGDHFKRDPQRVIRKSDSVALVEARQNAQQVQDWKQTLQQDTSAQRELKAAANEYADSNGYNSSDVNAPRDSNEVNNYSVNPYPYWFGYPSWYPYAYWYPYPYWYDWGFYYGPYGNMIVFGCPSFYFTNWYFWHPNHWNRYPHLGSAYIHNYYSPRRSYSMSRLVVHNWVQENRKYLPAGFIKNEAGRPEAIRQIGQLSQQSMDKNGRVNMEARDQNFSNNKSRYSALNDNPTQPKVEEEKQIPDVRQGYTRQPVVNPPRVQQQPSARQQPTTNKPAYNYNNIQRAQSYHNSGWEQAQPTRSQPQPSYHAQPQAPRSMPSAPSRGGGGGGRR